MNSRTSGLVPQTGRTSATQAHGLLLRKCACGSHAGPDNCPHCRHKSGAHGSVLKRRLTIGDSSDPLEHEADEVADQVIAAARPGAGAAPPRLQRRTADTAAGGEVAPASVDRVLAGSGNPLDATLQQDMGQRFGYDFSHVRVHSGGAAEQSARDVNAEAYTVGHQIVFGAGRFAPGTLAGRHLIAHELTHVVQQSASGTIRRCATKKGDSLYDGAATKIRATPRYKALVDKTLANTIIADAKKKPNCLYYAVELRRLFETQEKTPDVISKETKAATVKAVDKETARVAKPAEAKNLDIEEKASADPARKWVKVKGKFGGGSYQVDKTNPKNIVVKAKVFLQKAGTKTAVADVEGIKKMEDAIEKAASMKGFTVDIEFVNKPDADTFTAQVDTSEWEDATNWSGGEPKGFAHELLHMFVYELDRYDYIDAHASNQSMKVPKRLHWFAKQMTKPEGWDNPLSIMGSGEHPLDDDACRVAGLDVAACVAARQTPDKP